MAAADPLRTAALDAGDRLADALEAGDLDAAEIALHARQQALDALAGADLPALAPDLSARFRTQKERLQHLLRDRLALAREALTDAGRTAAAHGRYHTAGSPSPSVLDTAPRHR